MFIGIVAGLITCALWGLTFVAPRAVVPFSAVDLAVVRYGIFGFACLLLMLNPRFRPRGLSANRWCMGLMLGCAGYGGYFLAAAYAVKMAGAAIPPLIIGTMPVILAIIGNVREPTVRWGALLLPLGLIFSGVSVVNIEVLQTAEADRMGDIWLGVAASIAGLAIWVLYGLFNAEIMRAKDAPDGMHWTGVQGLGAGLGALLLVPMMSADTWQTASDLEIYRFSGWAVLLGLAGSWLATWCWVMASRRLPLALLAQLIVAETVFGLIYGFTFDQRWPTQAEWIGSLLQITGVGIAIFLFNKPKATLAVEGIKSSAAV